jgi:hypothetical protein
MMSINEQSEKQEGWIFRFWRILASWDDAINASPLESLDKRVAALEQAVLGCSRSGNARALKDDRAN